MSILRKTIISPFSLFSHLAFPRYAVLASSGGAHLITRVGFPAAGRWQRWTQKQVPAPQSRAVPWGPLSKGREFGGFILPSCVRLGISIALPGQRPQGSAANHLFLPLYPSHQAAPLSPPLAPASTWKSALASSHPRGPRGTCYSTFSLLGSETALLSQARWGWGGGNQSSS